MSKEHFRIVAIDETADWDQSVLAEYHIGKAFCLYAIREGEGTHCCSFTVDSWAMAIENMFIMDFDLDPSLRQEVCEKHPELAQNWQNWPMDILDQLREHAVDQLSHEALDDCYINFVDPKTYDKRFISERVTFSVNARQFKGGKKSDEYHTAVWDEAREYFQDGTPIIPILEYGEDGMATPYIAYQNECKARRMAENVPPLPMSGDQLPLFAAAWKRLPEAVVVSARGWVSEFVRYWYEHHPEGLAEADKAKGLLV